jgi:serine/threonine protein kinase
MAHSDSYYRIGEQLSGGGMGVVYQAEDTRLGRAVALKFLRTAFDNDKPMVERFAKRGRPPA